LATAMDKAKLLLLQLSDSGFPSGAFSHSFGFETYVSEGRITNGQEFYTWLMAFYEKQWIYNDGLALKLAYELLEQEKLDELWELDRRLTVLTIPKEQRLAGIRMGRRMLELARSLLQLPSLEGYAKQIERKRCFGQMAVVYALICSEYKVPLREALLHYAYSGCASIIQNAVRAIPLGQTEGQRLLFQLSAVLSDLAGVVEGLDAGDFGISPPGLELAAIRHERLDGRMFMS
jgi:urease accessory protein